MNKIIILIFILLSFSISAYSATYKEMVEDYDAYTPPSYYDSQFKSGQTHWRIEPKGDYCEVTYVSDMEPDIYIPPVVGKFLIKKSIRKGMHTSFKNLENISSVLAAREWLKDEQAIAETASDPLCDSCVSNAYDISE